MRLQIEQASVSRDGLLHVEGWIVGPQPVDRLQMFLGHAFLGLAELGVARADVGLDHPGDPRANWAGFRFLSDVSGDDVSARTVHARALLPGGAALRVSAAVDVATLGHAPEIPSAELHAACERCVRLPDGRFAISGWACGFSGIERITVALDDGEPVPAETGLSRPDIGNRFPRIPSARQSGFAFRGHLEHPALPPGSQAEALHVRLHAADGQTRLLRHPLGTAIAPRDGPRGVGRDLANRVKCCVERPATDRNAVRMSAHSGLTVQGWAIARDGLDGVRVLLDDIPLGDALCGLHRPDIAAVFVDWPEAHRSGFAVSLAPSALAIGHHTVRIVARDRHGREAEAGFSLDVMRDAKPLVTTQLRGRMKRAEIDIYRRILDTRATRPRFVVFLPLRDSGPGEWRRARATLRSLRDQAYEDWTARLLLPSGAAADEVPLEECMDLAGRLQVGIGGGPVSGDGPATHAMMLRAGDRLGCDALWEFALAATASPHAAFVYADERRLDPAEGAVAPDFRPQWSPDLLLSTNYIGRTWAAELPLLAQAGIGERDLIERGAHDLVLRLTEPAGAVRHVPKILCQTVFADAAGQDRAALRRALARRGIAGTVRAGAVPGHHVVRRRIVARDLVSIVMPTCGAGELVRAAIASIRANTGYGPVQLVAVDNIPPEGAATKAWLAEQADILVDAPGPFNWSRFNNLGARAATGRYLLFLNDDIEARDPGWLDALVEQAQRAEIGVVGARLLYPDGKIQHVGIHLAAGSGLHSFRFLPGSDPGPFGAAAALRNVTAVTGACLMVRREVFEALGGFDEAHAVINNDLDFCLRARQAGLEVVCTPRAELIHHELASRAHLSEAHDSRRFHAAWDATFTRGDRYRNPNLSRFSEEWLPEPEPTRVLVAGHPLLAAAEIRRIVALKLDHVGDFVTAIPALRRMKQRFPWAELHVLCHPVAVALAEAEAAIDRVIPFAVFHPASSRGRRRVPTAELGALAATLGPQRYDIAIDLRKHPETRPLLRATGARLLAGFDRDKAFAWLDVALDWDGDLRCVGKRNHVTADLLALVEAVAIACEKPPLDAAVGCGGIAPADVPARTGRVRICVHPGAGSPLKQWPPAHFAALMDMLVVDLDAEFVLVGAPAERRIASRILSLMMRADRVVSKVGATGLADMPVILRGCDLFVGNDSGPKHLAGFVGIPTIGIHSGVVDPAEWAPLGERSVAIHRQMSCSPCYLTRVAACGRGVACLRQLLPADVAALCRQMIDPGVRPARRVAPHVVGDSDADATGRISSSNLLKRDTNKDTVPIHAARGDAGVLLTTADCD